MIRIDEIYNNTFWPWMQEHLANKRVFFCDPPGHTSPDNLFNFGSDVIPESGYIFFHDQEPVHVDIYQPLFDDVVRRNKDLVDTYGDIPQGIVTSEKDSEFVEELCARYNWRSYYYFYHGWACLDWYRGYDRTFLIKRAKYRKPTRTFMSPNRLIGGHRDHRVLFLYEVFKRGLEQNHISCPQRCPEEDVDIRDIAKNYIDHFPDIYHTFDNANLPITYTGEDTQLMTSCWLTNFDEAADSMFYVPTETVYFGKRHHITEKTFKAIALEMPFILVAPAHSLKYLKHYGFKTFGDIIDESYDQEEDDFRRIEKVGELLETIESSSKELQSKIWKECQEIATFNYNHFYNGDFERVLWYELTKTLEYIKQDYET